MSLPFQNAFRQTRLLQQLQKDWEYSSVVIFVTMRRVSHNVQHKDNHLNIQEMINPYKNNGMAMAGNFRNKYLDDAQLQKPSAEVARQNTQLSLANIDRIIGVKTESAYGTYMDQTKQGKSEIVRFTSKGDNGGEATKQRIVKIQEVQVDPLVPPSFKHRKVPRGPTSPPPQVLRSPPRKITAKDQQDWKIPPCISNWKNLRGYTIPIHMRVGADGRNLQQNTINESFADTIDTLYIAERQAKSQLQERAKVQKSVAYKEYLKKEEMLRDAAVRARDEKAKLMNNSDEEDREEQQERQEIREFRAKQFEREERMKHVGAKKKKEIRERERDISEKIALGQAQPTNTELMYDERLFNQNGGLDAGFTHDDDDNVYDKPLFVDKTVANLYNVKETPDEEEQPGQVSQGKRPRDQRNQPVRFQKHKDDIFGLDSFVTKKLKKD